MDEFGNDTDAELDAGIEMPEGDADLETGSAGDADLETGSDGDAGQTGENAKYNAAVAQARDEKAKRQELEARLRSMEQMMAIQQANAPVNKEPQKTMFEQVQEELGYGDEEYLSAKQSAEIISEVNRRTIAQVQTQAAQTAFQAEHPDFGSVVGQMVNGTMVYTPEIQKIVQEAARKGDYGPYVTASQGGASAYNLVMQHRELAKLRQSTRATAADAAAVDTELRIQARTAPMSPASAAGARSVSPAKVTTVEDTYEIDRRIAAGEKF